MQLDSGIEIGGTSAQPVLNIMNAARERNDRLTAIKRAEDERNRQEFLGLVSRAQHNVQGKYWNEYSGYRDKYIANAGKIYAKSQQNGGRLSIEDYMQLEGEAKQLESYVAKVNAVQQMEQDIASKIATLNADNYDVDETVKKFNAISNSNNPDLQYSMYSNPADIFVRKNKPIDYAGIAKDLQKAVTIPVDPTTGSQDAFGNVVYTSGYKIDESAFNDAVNALWSSNEDYRSRHKDINEFAERVKPFIAVQGRSQIKNADSGSGDGKSKKVININPAGDGYNLNSSSIGTLTITDGDTGNTSEIVGVKKKDGKWMAELRVKHIPTPVETARAFTGKKPQDYDLIYEPIEKYKDDFINNKIELKGFDWEKMDFTSSPKKSSEQQKSSSVDSDFIKSLGGSVRK